MKTDKLIVLETVSGEIILCTDSIVCLSEAPGPVFHTSVLTAASSVNYVEVKESPMEIVRKIKEAEKGQRSPAMYLTSNLKLERELIQVLAEEDMNETKKS